VLSTKKITKQLFLNSKDNRIVQPLMSHGEASFVNNPMLHKTFFPIKKDRCCLEKNFITG